MVGGSSDEIMGFSCHPLQIPICCYHWLYFFVQENAENCLAHACDYKTNIHSLSVTQSFSSFERLILQIFEPSNELSLHFPYTILHYYL